MKKLKLYLVQHAKYVSEDENPDKPLSEVGKIDVLRVAKFLKGILNVALGTIFHSGKLRAKETADLLADVLDPKEVEFSESLSPLDDPNIWKKQLEEMKVDLMLVGHLPHLNKLASLLLSGDAENDLISFQMGGVLCLENDEKWKVKWMIVPDLITQFFFI